MITLTPAANAAVAIVGSREIRATRLAGEIPGVAFRSVLAGDALVLGFSRGHVPRACVGLASRPARVGQQPLAPCIQARPDDDARRASGARATANDDDEVDPLHRRRAALAPPGSFSTAPAVAPVLPAMAAASGAALYARAASSLEDLLPALVRRIAWSGDRQRGAVRLEIGSGELAGATLLIQAQGGVVRVHMNVPPGANARQWQQRIVDRLAARGVATDEVEVT